MSTPILQPGQVVTWYPVAGKPGVRATIKSITQRSAHRPALIKMTYRPYRGWKERPYQVPLALFLACLAPRPDPSKRTDP